MNTILRIIAVVNTAQLALAVWQLVDGRRNTIVVNNHPSTRETITLGDLARTFETWAKDQKRPGGTP